MSRKVSRKLPTVLIKFRIKMNKFSTMVPFGIRYISDWKEFELPDEPHIMNKVVTGCGFTEYFLRPNPKYPKVILVSPRRIILENKEVDLKTETKTGYS